MNDINSPENLNISTIPRTEAFGAFLVNTVNALREQKLDIGYVDSISRRAWADTIGAAQRHNDPGNFTTFIGYEYTASTPDMGNLPEMLSFEATVTAFLRCPTAELIQMILRVYGNGWID